MKFLIAVILVLSTGVSVESRGRIFGGSIADPSIKRFKYMANVVIPINETIASLCGASIISESCFLTTAHCWERGDESKTYVLYGLNENNQFTGSANAEKVIKNENYFHNGTHTFNDIALVFVSYINFNLYTQTIPLCNLEYLVGLKGVLAGWGFTANQSVSEELQFTTLTIVDDKMCREKLGSSYLPSQYCTLEKNTSSCEGDSGGPMTIIYNSIEQQIGLVSYGVGGDCAGDKPTAFTRVYSYLEWINSTMRNYEQARFKEATDRFNSLKKVF